MRSCSECAKEEAAALKEHKTHRKKESALIRKRKSKSDSNFRKSGYIFNNSDESEKRKIF